MGYFIQNSESKIQKYLTVSSDVYFSLFYFNPSLAAGGRTTTFARAAELDDFFEIAPLSPPSVFICDKYIFEF